MTFFADYARKPLKKTVFIYRWVKVQIYPSIETWIKTSLAPAGRHLCGILTKYLHTPKVTGAFSFKQILGLSKFLDPLFQVRRGSKPRLPGLGGPKLG